MKEVIVRCGECGVIYKTVIFRFIPPVGSESTGLCDACYHRAVSDAVEHPVRPTVWLPDMFQALEF